VSDPATLMQQMDVDIAALDTLASGLRDAADRLDLAERAWEKVLDDVTEALEDEFAEAGRKSVPEHTALSAARRQNRAVYQEWRSAKRDLERMQSQVGAKRATLNGRQSELGALREEARAPDVQRGYAHPIGARA
jgi:chromosome segregation ATPase